MRKKLPLLFLLFFVVISLSSQTVTVSESVTIRNDVAYDIIGKLKERVLLFRNKQTEYEIQAFDQKMRLSWNKEIEFEKKQVDIVGVVSSPEDFHIIYQYKKKGHPFLKINRYDPAANLLDSVVIKDFGTMLNTPDIEYLRSEDKTKVLLYHIHEQKDVEAFSFDLENMELLWEKEFTPNDWYIYRDFRQVLVANDGSMFFILEKENRKAKKDEHRFEIFQFNQHLSSIRKVDIPIPEQLTYDVHFTYDNLKKDIVAGGIYSENNRGWATGTFYLRLHPDNPDDSQLEFHEFDKKFVSTLMDKKTKSTKGITESDVQDVVLRQDGGILIIGERNKIYERRLASTSRAYSSTLGHYSVDFYFDDIFVISIHPNGKLHWQKVFHKRQYSQDDDAMYSSFFLLKTPRSLRLLFNDEIRHENTVSEYVIKGSGKSDRNSIFSTENQQIRLRFRDSQQVASNEILVPSERRHKLKLVRVTY